MLVYTMLLISTARMLFMCDFVHMFNISECCTCFDPFSLILVPIIIIIVIIIVPLMFLCIANSLLLAQNVVSAILSCCLHSTPS